MSTPTLSALARVIESFDTFATPEELVSETADVLTFGGFKPDMKEIRAAIRGAVVAGGDAIRNGAFEIALEPPKLLAIDEWHAVPLRHATRADLLAHRAFMRRRRNAALAKIEAADTEPPF